MKVYYNEFEPYAAQWLRNLMAQGLIPVGDVDERSIVDVRASDILEYDQAHFFAGIGGWAYALQLAGWNAPVWTGSCPCQPFSVAGKGKAQSDERHLWPYWFRLIAEVRPPIIFGEQVAGAIAHGWLDDAFDDLEREGYETGACVLPACSVGAPHKRDRLWFVGYSQRNGLSAATQSGSVIAPGNHNAQGEDATGQFAGTSLSRNGEAMANSDSTRLRGRISGIVQECAGEQFTGEGNTSLADAGLHDDRRSNWPWFWEREPYEAVRYARERGRQENGMPIPESLLGRVAYGIPFNACRLRAYGNAIVPQVAAEFIKAAMICRP